MNEAEIDATQKPISANLEAIEANIQGDPTGEEAVAFLQTLANAGNKRDK